MSENIHIKMEYAQAKESKRKILSSEINLLEIKKHLSNYKQFRMEELTTKEKINQKIKKVKTEITKLEKILPKLKIPKILRKKEIEEIRTIKEPKKEIKRINQSEIERQLMEIKSKLQQLQE
jgi:hypothetical protein